MIIEYSHYQIHRGFDRIHRGRIEHYNLVYSDFYFLTISKKKKIEFF